MPGTAVATVLLGLHFIAALDAEAGVGIVPQLGSTENGLAPSEPGATLSLRPSAGWIDVTPRGVRFSVSYEPTASWRVPNIAGPLIDPVLVHQLALRYSPVLLPRTSLTFTSLTSVGEIDFSLNPGLLGSDETARSQAPVARIFTQSAIASFSHKLAPRWTFQLATPFSYQGPFGKSDDSAEGLSDTTLTAGAAPSISYQLTRLDAIDLAGNTAWAKFESSEQLSSQLTLGWKRGLSTNVQGNISAGLGRTDLLSGDPVITADGEPLPNPQYFGVGGIGFTHTRQYGLDSVQLSLDARVDPFVQTVRPQATLSMASSLRVKSDVELGAGLSANAVTDSNPLPAEASGNGTTASETGLNASMGVTWGNGDLRYRTGVRASARGTHWAADPFEIREELALATFGMTWDIVPAPQQ